MSLPQAGAATGPTTPAELLISHAGDPRRVFASVQEESGDIETISYAQELDRARRTAAALSGLGVGAGDRVQLQLGSCLEFYDVWFATALLGATMVPTNPASTRDDLAYMLHDAEPVLSVVEPGQVPLATQAAQGTHTTVVPIRGLDSIEASAQLGEPAPLRRVDAAGVSSILYTSGTTSRPKGVMVTGANYVAVGRAVAGHLQLRAEDRWLVVLPLFHANAQYYCTMSALAVGASITVIPKFSASRWAAQALAHRATLASLFAAPIRMILAAGGQPARTSLRAVLFAQNIADEQAAAFEARFGTRLLQLYGMTETVLPPTMNPNSPARRWDSIGQPLPGVRIRLVDDSGIDVLDGSSGQMLVGGAPGVTIAAGYLNQPAAAAEAVTDGWLRTGDLARVDADGFYYFVDRAKDMIKRSGENVAASEVERAVNDHPAVFESAAIGIPDPLRDQAIVVYAVLHAQRSLDPEDLLAWCRERLAPFKVPSAVFFVDALPRTSVGKIRKEQLRSAAGVASTPSDPNPLPNSAADPSA